MLGFDAKLQPTGADAALSGTVDGGATRHQVGSLPRADQVLFVDARHGWLGGYFSSPALYATADSGRTWHPASLAVPARLQSWARAPDLPTFTDPMNGVLPITLRHRGQGAVVFDVTDDGGLDWRLASVLRLSQLPHGESSARGLPLQVAVGSSAAWWVLANDPLQVFVTSDAGRHWRTRRTSFNQFTTIQAIGARWAWLDTRHGAAFWLYLTTDGGRSWIRLRPRR